MLFKIASIASIAELRILTEGQKRKLEPKARHTSQNQRKKLVAMNWRQETEAGTRSRNWKLEA